MDAVGQIIYEADIVELIKLEYTLVADGGGSAIEPIGERHAAVGALIKEDFAKCLLRPPPGALRFVVCCEMAKAKRSKRYLQLSCQYGKFVFSVCKHWGSAIRALDAVG